jgi:hypothetical protein
MFAWLKRQTPAWEKIEMSGAIIVTDINETKKYHRRTRWLVRETIDLVVMLRVMISHYTHVR